MMAKHKALLLLLLLAAADVDKTLISKFTRHTPPPLRMYFYRVQPKHPNMHTPNRGGALLSSQSAGLSSGGAAARCSRTPMPWHPEADGMIGSVRHTGGVREVGGARRRAAPRRARLHHRPRGRAGRHHRPMMAARTATPSMHEGT